MGVPCLPGSPATSRLVRNKASKIFASLDVYAMFERYFNIALTPARVFLKFCLLMFSDYSFLCNADICPCVTVLSLLVLMTFATYYKL